MVPIKDCPPGSRIIIHKYDNGSIVDTYKADVIALDGDHVLVGWKQGEHKPKGVHEKKDLSPETTALITNYQFAWWYSIHLPVELVSTLGESRASSTGLACACCKNFNHYAEPNLPDNRYGCYSCRSSGRIK